MGVVSRARRVLVLPTPSGSALPAPQLTQYRPCMGRGSVSKVVADFSPGFRRESRPRLLAPTLGRNVGSMIWCSRIEAMPGRSSALHPFMAFKRPLIVQPRRMMARITHEERTATERREASIHAVTIAKVDQILPNIRLLRLKPQRSTEDEATVKARNGSSRQRTLLIVSL